MYRFGSRVAPEEEIPMKPTQMGLWALILAGDVTKRLLPLTTRLGGAPDRFVTMPVSGPRRVVATLRSTGQPMPWFWEATASWRMEENA